MFYVRHKVVPFRNLELRYEYTELHKKIVFASIQRLEKVL